MSVVMDIDVARLIEGAEFDEWDRDSATCGYCGSFAIALYDLLSDKGAEPRLLFASANADDGIDKNLAWRHALVKVGDSLFDIDGEVQPDHVLENYCWGFDESKFAPCFVEVDRDRMMHILKITNAAHSEKKYMVWGQALRGSLMDMVRDADEVEFAAVPS